ncbi:hypothetical protein diail_9392, partial [Diaporthe ilicicola]
LECRLWARLILHFWAMAMSEDAARPRGPSDPPYLPDPIAYLEKAYEQTKEATSGPDWQGTTTATGAQLFYKTVGDAEPAEAPAAGESSRTAPMLYVTNLGDSQVMVVRPSSGELVFKTKEQWHWFDCPRQLGTNSPDTPAQNAVLDQVPIEEGDVVLAMSDGVIDNLWSHEIVENVSNSVKRWATGDVGRRTRSSDNPGGSGSMAFVAEELMLAAKTIALDPFAESPFMEHAIDEGLPSEGGESSRTLIRVKRRARLTCQLLGKLDDITVVAALCTRNDDVNWPPIMRGKRSKQYRKLLKQFELAFGFRQPYQVLVDAELVKDAHRFAMDLPQYLANTLHGEVKILITQCSMRHLYAQNKEPGVSRAIDKAKDYERRRCGHHPDEFPEPCSTLECLSGVVGPKNKHRYVVASQDPEVRAKMRAIPGVPLVYINRSVMIVSLPPLHRFFFLICGSALKGWDLEPMAAATTRVVHKGERAKFRAELKQPETETGGKRKRDGDDSDGSGDGDDDAEKKDEEPKKKKKRKGEKGPNPLSVKKSKKQPQQQESASKPKQEENSKDDASLEQPAKKKRKRRTKRAGGAVGVEAQDAPSGAAEAQDTASVAAEE